MMGKLVLIQPFNMLKHELNNYIFFHLKLCLAGKT